jgi:hypothetical protein
MTLDQLWLRPKQGQHRTDAFITPSSAGGISSTIGWRPAAGGFRSLPLTPLRSAKGLIGPISVSRKGARHVCAARENLRSLWEFKKYVAAVTNCVGITVFLRVARLAEAVSFLMKDCLLAFFYLHLQPVMQKSGVVSIYAATKDCL